MSDEIKKQMIDLIPAQFIATATREIQEIEKQAHFQEWFAVGYWLDKSKFGHVSLPIVLMASGLEPNEYNLKMARLMAHTVGEKHRFATKDGVRNFDNNQN